MFVLLFTIKNNPSNGNIMFRNYSMLAMACCNQCRIGGFNIVHAFSQEIYTSTVCVKPFALSFSLTLRFG